jgi:hypothetical protein
MFIKVLETGVFFHRGTWKGWSFPRDLQRRVRFFYQENFLGGIRETLEGFGKGQLSPNGTPLGNLKGVSFTGAFEIQ